MIYFFIHTPKTSGTTFVDLLQKQKDDKVGFFYPPKDNMHDLEKFTNEAPLYNLKRQPDWGQNKYITGHFAFGIHEILSTTSFSYLGVVRDPVDHYLSTYNTLLRMPASFREKVLPGDCSLNSYLNLPGTANMQTFYLSGLSQKEIANDKTRAFQQVIDNYKQYFSGIYITEYFDHGLFYFQQKIGLSPKCYSKKNVEKKEVQREKLSPEMIRQIQQVTDVDQQVYGYLVKEFKKSISSIPGIERKVRLFKAKNAIYNVFGSFF